MKTTSAFGLLFFTVFFSSSLLAQTVKEETLSSVSHQDSLVTKKAPKGKSPKVAGLLSVIPGCGQIYNGKIWKVPLVYGVLGASGYWLYYNHSQYVYYRDENRLRLNGKTLGLKPELSGMSTQSVASYENYYHRYQELGIFLFVACYGLNIVDAMVDAHFSTYDVSENLSMNVRPFVFDPMLSNELSAPAMGLSLTFKRK